MRHLWSRRSLVALGIVASLLAVAVPAWRAQGADHREGPLISEDPPADIADVLAFTSFTDPSKVVFGLTVNGFAVPAVRGSYSFSQDVLYQIKIDNDGDAVADLVIQVEFDGLEAVRDSRCPAMTSGSLAGQGGQFLTVRGPAPPRSNDGVLSRRLAPSKVTVQGCTNLVLGPTAGGFLAFAGLRDDSFVVDIGQLNRILGGTQDVFRGFTSPALGPLAGRPVRTDGTSGSDGFGGYNVSTFVIEVPKALVQGADDRTGTYLLNNTTIGVWGTTHRRHTRRLPAQDDDFAKFDGPYVQVQRAGHQTIKTVFIPQALRDEFNRSQPADDMARWGQFFPDALTTTDNDGMGNTIAGRASLLDAVGVTTLPNGAPLLLPSSFGNTDPELIRKVLLPDVLRLDLSLPATDLAVGGNGLQNGRRPGDDVIDILLRVARQLADVKFPDGSTLPGSGPVGTRRALDCSALPCPDRRVLAVLQGTDFYEPDSAVTDLSTSGVDRPLLGVFPYFATSHPLPGAAGTVGFPPQQ
jgi:hypothetical protein